MRRIFAVALLMFGPAAFAGLLVTEATGKAEIEGKGSVTTLAEIPDGTRVTVPAGAQVVAVDLVSGREFVLKGGGNYLIAPGGPKGADGKFIEAKLLPATNLPKVGNMRIAKGTAAQASLVMRSLQKTNIPLLVSPVRTAVITQTPVFRWNAVDAVNEYRLLVTALDGATIWDVSTRETEMVLPADRKLVPGERYNWRIQAIGEGGMLSDASTRFSVVQAEAMKRLGQLEPGADAPFGRRVLYAAQLREAGAVAEANEIWRMLSREHPDDAVIRLLAE